jgi:putative transposase
MPEHVHLLISEPERSDPSVVVKVIKQEFARIVLREIRNSGWPTHSCTLRMSGEEKHPPNARLPGEMRHVWQKRFYDFNVWTEHKRIEKLRYMHRNPVKRGLVNDPDQWAWSSFRAYAYGEHGLVRVNAQEWELEIKRIARQTFG